MRKRMKIWFHAGNFSEIRELSIPRTVAVFLLFLGTLAIAGTVFVGYDYLRLKSMSFDNQSLAQTILAQTDEIKTQRIQIQNFAQKIETLKTQVSNLSKFEDKVRLIADIKQTSNSSGLIGIGAIPKDELDTDIPLDQKHNNLMREMHQQVTLTNFAAKKQSLDFEKLIELLEKKRNLLASTPSVKPVDGWITSQFGHRVSPFTDQKEFHSGLDIANKAGTPVIATANGRISYAGGKMYIGNLVVIDHGYGRVTKYGHLQKVLVKSGQEVKRGDVIALMGNTGRSTGPHLHYEVRINGTPVDPLKYILN